MAAHDDGVDDLGLGSLLAPAPAPSDGAARARQVGDVRRRRATRARAAVGVVATLVIVAGLAVAIRRPDAGTVDAAGPTGSTSPATAAVHQSTTTVAPPPELPTRPVPDGWQAVEFGDIRFAVPGDWKVSGPGASPCMDASGRVVLLEPRGVASCPNLSVDGVEPSYVRVSRDVGAAAPSGAPVHVGDLDAIDPAPDRPCCTEEYVLPGSLRFSVQAQERHQILDTLTWSARHRALHEGPLLDTSGWQTIKELGVRLKVPADWSIRSLATHDEIANPGLCGARFFPALFERQVVVGATDYRPPCPKSPGADTTPVDGVWITTTDSAPPLEAPHLLDESRPREIGTVAPELPVIEILPQGGESSTSLMAQPAIIVGAGPDPAVARTILSTIRSGA